MTLDLTHPQGIKVMHRLIEWIDVFIESNAPGVVIKFGLDYENVKKIKSHIIMLSTCQMGQKGHLLGSKGMESRLRPWRVSMKCLVIRIVVLLAHLVPIQM